MKLNPKSVNFNHLKQFSHLYPDIVLEQFEDLKCEICNTKMGKYDVSDPYGFIPICNRCLENEN
jgi:hypothetical protein